MPVGVPKIELAIGLTVSAEPLYERVRAVLKVAPMTNTELGKELGVSQSTVSRWANGDTRPTLEQAVEVLEVIEGRLDEIRSRLDRAREAVELGREVVEAWDAVYDGSLKQEDLDHYREIRERAESVIGTPREAG